jgi:hypothetical protein
MPVIVAQQRDSPFRFILALIANVSDIKKVLCNPVYMFDVTCWFQGCVLDGHFFVGKTCILWLKFKLWAQYGKRNLNEKYLTLPHHSS